MARRRVRGSLAAVADPKHLRGAWVEIQLGKRSGARKIRGADGVSLNSYAEALDDNLNILSDRLLRGVHTYSPLLPHFEEKVNGKYRVICVPTVRDRVVQRALLDYLLAYDKGRFAFTTDVSYGFVKGRRVIDAVNKAKALRTAKSWAYKADIRSFFDEIPRDKMKATLRVKMRVPGILPLLEAACDCEARPGTRGDAQRLKQQGIRTGHGLRQGMPLSPYFSNVFLADFDQQVMVAKIDMVRYADDLVFFADSETACKAIDNFCRKALAAIGLNIYPLGTADKCEIKPPDQAVEFLGVELAPRLGGYTLRLSNKQIAKKRENLFAMSNVDGLLAQRLTITKFAQRIRAKIDGWLDAYAHCDNIVAFEQQLENWRLHVVKEVLVTGLGLPEEKLNRSAKQFLELAPLPELSKSSDGAKGRKKQR